MQTAEYDYQDFAKTSEADKGLLVRFFYKEVQDKAATLTEGRPMFREKTYIEIRIAGKRDPQACRPATFADKQRFPAHLEAFEKRTAAPVEGMPLTEWPQITRSQVEELSFLNVKTVEQLANMSDTNVSQFRGGYTLKANAAKWLTLNEQAAEQRDKDEMSAKIAKLEAMVEQLTAAVPVGGIDVRKSIGSEDVVESVNEVVLSGGLDNENDADDDGLQARAEEPVEEKAAPRRRKKRT